MVRFNPWRDTRVEGDPVDEHGFRDSDYGGDHFMGTGTYEARTPEQAAALRAGLPQGSAADAGPEPPLSPSGHAGYTDEEFEAWDAAGRPQNHDYLRPGPGQIDGTGFGTRGRGSGGLSGWGR